MKTYFITGGAGYLGSNIVKLVCEKNIDKVSRIIVFDLRIGKTVKEELAECCKIAGIEIEFIIGNITNKDSINEAIKQVDVVIHAAALIDYRSLISYEVLKNINVKGTQNVIDCCLGNNVQYLVYTSSIEAVCPNESGKDFVEGTEDTPYGGEPMGKYGKSKKEAEQLVRKSNGYKLANNKDFRTVALRMAGIYGENDPYIGNTIDRSLKNKTVIGIRGKANSRMYIGNAAWCHLLAAKQLQTDDVAVGGEAYFIRDESPDLHFGEMNMQFLEHRGFIFKYSPLPFSLLYAIIWIITLFYKLLHLFGSKKEPAFTAFTLRVVQTTFTVSDEKFRKHFGYIPLYTWNESRDRMRKFVDSYIDN